MADIKLFRLINNQVESLPGTTSTIEKSLQVLFEANLETLLGVTFLATEFVTSNGGRMDTLGLDENKCPVIIEYKRASNENVITQGLFYLDWLMDHRKEFQWLVMQKLGKSVAEVVDWSNPRLICVAGDFSHYDNYAVKQIPRNIELIRYRRYGSELLLLDLVANTSGKTAGGSSGPAAGAATLGGSKYKTIGEVKQDLSPAVLDRYEALRAFILALGEDVQESTLQFYIAFKRMKNFACVEFRPTSGRIILYLKVDPKSLEMVPNFLRDVSKIGHYGTGDLEVTLGAEGDLEKAMPLIEESYANS